MTKQKKKIEKFDPAKVDLCRWCNTMGHVKYYIIADDMENPKPYHPKCFDEMWMDVMRKITDESYRS